MNERFDRLFHKRLRKFSFHVAATCGAALLSSVVRADRLPGFTPSPWFGEQTLEEKLPEGIRLVWLAPGDYDSRRPTSFIIYATPNGNTIEQTLGRQMGPGVDWHFDIQHIAAQTRLLRARDRDQNVVLVCTEADGLSWPAWRQKHADNAEIIHRMVDSIERRLPAQRARVDLTAHSGGGSLIWGFINGAPAIPSYVGRIAFLDANYSYSSEDRHGDKLVAWLNGDPARRLIVMAYDDRNIVLNDKPVIGPTGGTYRATHRMLDDFRKQGEISETHKDPFNEYRWQADRAFFLILSNQQNKILHTALVGEMNGFLHAMTLDTRLEERWGSFGGPRAYMSYVQPATPVSGEGAIPPRPSSADSGSKSVSRISLLLPKEREDAILSEILRGNIPEFLRQFVPITIALLCANGSVQTVTFEAMPDYLAIGSESDFVRMPMTPMTAQKIADRFGCILPTRKMVDLIYEAAEIKLEPHPLTVDREAVTTFAQHNAIIEGQRAGRPLGKLIGGHKKDVVITNLLQSKPESVAIYGWHKLDGKPIQPLTTVHRNSYVDYSHGIRLVRNTVTVDGVKRPIAEILADPTLCRLLSDEGTITHTSY